MLLIPTSNQPSYFFGGGAQYQIQDQLSSVQNPLSRPLLLENGILVDSKTSPQV